MRNTDIAPTVLDAEALEADPRMSGRTLLPLVRGEKEEARVVVSEGRGTRAILWGRWRLIAHDGHAEDSLFDLDDDPGERHDVARAHADVVAEMRARLTASLANARAADVGASGGTGPVPTIHLRFAGGGRVHRVAGTLNVGDSAHGASPVVEAIGFARSAVRIDGPRIDFALATSPHALVGLDVRIDPPAPR